MLNSKQKLQCPKDALTSCTHVGTVPGPLVSSPKPYLFRDLLRFTHNEGVPVHVIEAVGFWATDSI